jgi:hypothetical protein
MGTSWRKFSATAESGLEASGKLALNGIDSRASSAVAAGEIEFGLSRKTVMLAPSDLGLVAPLPHIQDYPNFRDDRRNQQ